jgi:transcriptional regulator with XRE-family HTH domain
VADARHRANVALGARLRALRQDLGLSLAEVEATSGGAINAVVLGSYERGDRTVSVIRLEELAEFYGVLAEDLVADLVRQTSTSAQLLSALRELKIATQIVDWHDAESGARGVQIRLSSESAAALLTHLAPSSMASPAEPSVHEGTDR